MDRHGSRSKIERADRRVPKARILKLVPSGTKLSDVSLNVEMLAALSASLMAVFFAKHRRAGQQPADSTYNWWENGMQASERERPSAYVPGDIRSPAVE